MTLHPKPNSQNVIVYQDTLSKDLIRVPIGSKAIVLNWPSLFTSPIKKSPTKSYCQIKLLNGPLKGESFWIDSHSISIIDRKP